jgi:hypothetical protein
VERWWPRASASCVRPLGGQRAQAALGETADLPGSIQVKSLRQLIRSKWNGCYCKWFVTLHRIAETAGVGFPISFQCLFVLGIPLIRHIARVLKFNLIACAI